MSSYSEIIFAVLDGIKPLNQTQTSIPEELVKYHIKTVRADLAKQTIKKYGILGNQWFQSLGCIPVVETDKSECCAYPTGCTILKLDIDLPNTIDSETNLMTVQPVNITDRPFQYIEYERVPFEGTNKYTKNFTKWFTTDNNNRVYLLVNSDDYLTMGIEVVSIFTVLEDPEEAVNFTDCSTGVACFSDKAKYPIPETYVSLLIDMVIKKLLLVTNQPIDSSNDNKTNPETTITKGS